MALTVTIDTKRPTPIQGTGIGIASGTIKFDSLYPTGGEALTDLTKHFKDVYTLVTDNYGGIATGFSRASNLLLAYWTSNTTDGEAMVEVTNATDLSAITVSFIATGRY